MNAAVFQAGAVIPLLLLLIAYTLTHPIRRTIHRYLIACLVAMTFWCLSMAAAFSEGSQLLRAVGFTLSEIWAAVLTPLCVLTIGYFVRIEMVEDGRAQRLIWPPFAFFTLAMLTDPLHHWVFRDWSRFVDLRRPDEWAGPLFWAFSAWAFFTMFVSVGIIIHGLRRTTDRPGRQRLLLILGAIGAPTVAHAAYLGSWLPIDYPLTPASIGVTGLLLVAGIRRLDLLDGGRLVRRDVIEHLRDGVLVATAEGVVVDANPRAVELLGGDRQDWFGRRLVDAASHLAREATGDGTERATRLLDADRISASTEIETRDGRSIELHSVVIRPDGGSDGPPEGRFLILRDRSAERRSERLLYHRQRLESVGVLAAGVAHEVNNPLAYVRANLGHVHQLSGELEKSVGSASPAEWGELREVVGESLNGLDRISRIVERLLRFSRPSEGRCTIDVNDLVDEAVRFASLHRSPNVEVERQLDPALPALEASPDRLLQALLNLLLNARQALAGRDGGRIAVRTATGPIEGGRELIISVEDNGPGIDARLRDRIFDPFFTTRPPGEGTGLGLAIAYDIVREHDGTLEVGDSATGGAAFAIRIPV